MIRRAGKNACPEIRMFLPGPLARQIIDSEAPLVSPSYTRDYPLVVKRGEGVMIEDVDGNRFLDFTAGIAVCTTGHSHPRVVKAIQRQAATFLHMSGTDFHYSLLRDLAAKLVELAPGDFAKRVFFTNSGTEAVEAAFKLARYATRRPRIVAFYGGFHGRTMGSLSLTASKSTQQRGFAPLVPGVHHIQYPNGYRRPTGLSEADFETGHVREQLESLFKRNVPPEEVAAIIVEPIQGEGGYIVPPPKFHRELMAICHEHGILFIADEVQSGMGRTGKMFAIEHWGVEPDIICLAKGIASGLPLGAMIARDEVMTWKRGAHGSTFGGNPLSCAAALETIALLKEGLMANATDVGTHLRDGLRDIQKRQPLIGDVRGLGLMIGMELVTDRQTRQPACEARDQFVQRAFHKGLLLLGCGESTIRFCPPLIVTREEAQTALEIIEVVFREMSPNAASS